jgi:[ribosomal protein S5]-alanine N-acetyltransferase
LERLFVTLAPDLTSATTNIRLAPFHDSDVTDAYVAWMRDPAIIRFTEVAPDSATLKNCRDYVRSNNASAASILWRIMTPDDGADDHVGNIRMSVNAKHRRGEVALIIGRADLHGQGIGGAAIGLVRDHAFHALGLHKLTCGIYASNQGSEAAFAKCGFKVEATFRDHVVLDGQFEDIVRMACFA